MRSGFVFCYSGPGAANGENGKLVLSRAQLKPPGLVVLARPAPVLAVCRIFPR
jgi:hypothetical protein